MKKILTIQDISCFGKCSLTVALPLLSSMGIETYYRSLEAGRNYF